MNYPVFNDEFMNKYDQMTPAEHSMAFAKGRIDCANKAMALDI